MREASPSQPALIDAAELARWLSVSKPTIWRLREDGKLPPAISLTSQCIRWRRADVESWLASGCPVVEPSPMNNPENSSEVTK